MSTRDRSTLLGCGAVLAGALATSGGVQAEDASVRSKPAARTATSSAAAARALSPEEIELAQYLDLLESSELLADFDLLKLWPILEDQDAR